MSRENCCRFFRQMTGRTISGYLNDYRISRGTHLLNTTDLTVSDIASMTGFSSASRFAAAFRTKTGFLRLNTAEIISERRYHNTKEALFLYLY